MTTSNDFTPEAAAELQPSTVVVATEVQLKAIMYCFKPPSDR